MNKKDKVILAELSINARIPIKTLSKKLQISESATIYHIEKLRQKNILLGTHVIINSYKLGKTGFRAYFSLKKVFDQKEKEIVSWLIQRGEVHILGKERNISKYVLMSWTQTVDEFHTFLVDFKLHFGEYIMNLDIQPYIAGLYFARKYLIGNERIEIESRICEKENVDELDIQILKLLSNDARKSSLSIAKELNKDVQTIISRIKILSKKGIILGYGINLNIEALGFHYYKLNIIFSKKISRSTTLEFARSLDSTVYVDETIGPYDFELNVEVESQEQLQTIIKNLETLGNGLEYLDIIEIEKYEKLLFI